MSEPTRLSEIPEAERFAVKEYKMEIVVVTISGQKYRFPKEPWAPPIPLAGTRRQSRKES